MKVYIGPYTNWIGPYQIAEKILFWRDKENDHSVHEFGKWLAEKADGSDTWLTRLCQWIHSKKVRKIKVHIDNYDVWNMDHTLSHIILPMLQQLQKTKHGAPFVDLDDVPAELHPTDSPDGETGHVDNTHFKRWEYVIGEMIYAFEHKVDDSWEDEFTTGVCDWEFEEETEKTYTHESGKVDKLYRLKEGPNHTYKCDYDAIQLVHERMQNGFRLFGKYYNSLWD